MKLTWRDAVATLLAVAVVVPYGIYVVGPTIGLGSDASGHTTLGILDPTWMSVWALALGAIAAFIGGWVVVRGAALIRLVTGGLGVVALALVGLGLTGLTFFNVNVWVGVMGSFVAAIVLLWGIAIGRHAGLAREGEARTPEGLAHA